MFALQLVKTLGATVQATTASATKGEALRRLGADEVINHVLTPDWGRHLKKAVTS